MVAAIETHGLTKYYGRTRGVEDLELQVEQGEIFGFLGPNGAGKTTTIRPLMGFLRPTRGWARIFGLDCWRQAPAVHARVGNVPAEFNLYDELTGEEYLRFQAALRGLHDLNWARELAARFDLDLRRRIRGYSRGMKQKLGLIQASMHRPLDRCRSASRRSCDRRGSIPCRACAAVLVAVPNLSLFGTVALFLSSFLRRRPAGGLSLGFVFASYPWTSFAPLVERLRGWQSVSLLSLYRPLDAYERAPAVRDVATLLALTALLLVASLPLFQRKDLGV